MKNIFIKAVLIFMTAFLFCCKQRDAGEKYENSIQSFPKKKIAVRLIGEVRARKSYASIQFMQDQKEIDKYLEKQAAGNPTVDYEFDFISKYLAAAFERQGLIKNGEIILKNFKKQTDEKTIYTDISGRQINLLFYNNQLTGHCHFKLLSAADSVDIDTGGTSLQDLDYSFMDIIPGDNKELVYLNDYYIMNGDNFDFMIYQININ